MANIPQYLRDFISTIQNIAYSGSYNDLANKPTISTVGSTGSYNDLTNKPTISTVGSTGSYNDLTDKPGLPSLGDFKHSAQLSNHNMWLLCNGQNISRTTYSLLFSLIGTSFGVGDGSTTFGLPDCRGRVTGSIGSGSGLTTRTAGQLVGAETHTLTVNEIPSHRHLMPNTCAGTNNRGWANLDNQSPYANSSNYTDYAGGGLAHNNMQPTIFLGNTFIYAGV